MIFFQVFNCPFRRPVHPPTVNDKSNPPNRYNDGEFSLTIATARVVRYEFIFSINIFHFRVKLFLPNDPWELCFLVIGDKTNWDVRFANEMNKRFCTSEEEFNASKLKKNKRSNKDFWYIRLWRKQHVIYFLSRVCISKIPLGNDYDSEI